MKELEASMEIEKQKIQPLDLIAEKLEQICKGLRTLEEGIETIITALKKLSQTGLVGRVKR